MSQIKEEEEEDKTRIKTLTKSILYNSTAQACVNLVHTRHCVLKLFLGVCICSTLVASSFFVITNVLMYFQFEVTTVSRQVFDDHEKGTTLFPCVFVFPYREQLLFPNKEQHLNDDSTPNLPENESPIGGETTRARGSAS